MTLTTPARLCIHLSLLCFFRLSIQIPLGTTIHDEEASHIHNASYTQSSDANTKVWDPLLTPYPPARRDLCKNETFKSALRGTVQINDPYHWLHDPDSEETRKFVRDESNFTENFLQNYPHRNDLLSALRYSWNYSRFDIPSIQEDGYYYFGFNSGLESKGKIYRVRRGDEEKALKPNPAHPEDPVPGGDLFFDPSLLSIDETASVNAYVFSESGKFMAYTVSINGSDTTTLYVRRTDSPHTKSAEDGGVRGQDPGRMSDVVNDLRWFAPVWAEDDSGLFYTRFPNSTTKDGVVSDSMLYFHKLGDPPEKDTLIMKDPQNPDYTFACQTFGDGKYLALYIYKASLPINQLWIANLKHQPLGPHMNWNKIVTDFNHSYSAVAYNQSRIYLMTNKDALLYKVVVYDLDKPKRGFRDLIPQDHEATLKSVTIVNKDKLLLLYLRDVKSELYLHDLATGRRIKRLASNLVGQFSNPVARATDSQFFFSFQTLSAPETIYSYKFDAPKGKKLKVFRKIHIKSLNPDDFITKQVFYHSKDGTRVPMFITHHKNFKQDGTAPAIQSGYGGFAYNFPIRFNPTIMTFVARFGGVHAVALIRGGGEYGEEWHKEAIREQRQNAFDDFQWATKYLIQHRYTSASKVTITGSGNGGLLVAACVNQAPELYGAALSSSGVMDMLRYSRFTEGNLWIPEYGDPNDPKDFDHLLKISPLQNINPQATYPAIMAMTSDHDDGVVPLHTLKYVAELQYKLAKNLNPLLLRVEIEGVQSGGTTTDVLLKLATDEVTFIALALGLNK